MKGHLVRVTVATHRHTVDPTFEELTKAYAVLHDYMKKQNLPLWYIVDKTFGRWPNHWHIVSCDALGTPEELELLAKTPKVKFQSKKVMIGIPAHDESEHIFGVVSKAKKYGKIVVYDDGSEDHTAEKAFSAGAKVIRGTHKGYGAALNYLFKEAITRDFDVLITLDGDGQHNPDEIPLFLDALCSTDMVIGNRFLGGSSTPKYRELFIRGVNTILNVGDSQCGFRAYNRRALEAIKITKFGFDASLEILTQAKDLGLKIAEVPCKISYSGTEHSESPLHQGAKLLETLFWGTIWTRPLLFLGLPALLFYTLSIGLGLYLVSIYAAQKYLIPNITILTIASAGSASLLAIAAFFILVQRKLLKEIEK